MIQDITPLQYPIPRRVLTVRLADDWYACDGANATVLAYTGTDTPAVDTQEPLWVFDTNGVINGMLLSADDGDGNLYLPAGMAVVVFQPEGVVDGHWEPLTPGTNCAGGSGSGSGDVFPKECGVPCPPAGCAMEWKMDDASGCYVLVCCPGSGSGSGSSPTGCLTDCSSCNPSAAVVSIPGFTPVAISLSPSMVQPCTWVGSAVSQGYTWGVILVCNNPPGPGIPLTTPWGFGVSTINSGGGINQTGYIGNAMDCPQAGTYSFTVAEAGNTAALGSFTLA